MVTGELGGFLREQRNRLTPAAAGIVGIGRRRVPGLRREEVAALAGVSVDYYARLEQGRERAPSVQVLEALGAALRLEDDGRVHLNRLAGLAVRPHPPLMPDRVDPALLRLMDGWPHHPALVYNRAYDVLAANPLGRAFFGGAADPANLMLLLFTDPRGRSFYRDWDAVAADAAAGLRLHHAEAPDDPRVAAVIAELTATSDAFRRLWAEHRVRGKALAVKRFAHPVVGGVTLRMQTFGVRSAPGQELVVYDAEPGTRDAEALARLAGTT